MRIVAITGAAGNLGGILAECMVNRDCHLNLLIHKKDVSNDLKSRVNVSVLRIDLADPNTLMEALDGVDAVVHFAGVLFKANPEKFLPTTNVQYFKNLLDMACVKKVKRIILISFPHVEGETTPDNPAKGSLEGKPTSAHARTRLEEEKLLFSYAETHGFEPVSLRVGMVYGKGVLMIDAGQWFARYGILGVRRKPTWIHLISKDDFVSATISAVEKKNINGIYHIGDEGVQTLQQFLDDITTYKGNFRPWRMPLWMIMTAARVFEGVSSVFNTQSPLTVDFVKIGMVSYYGDTSRMKAELLSELKYNTYKDGMSLF